MQFGTDHHPSRDGSVPPGRCVQLSHFSDFFDRQEDTATVVEDSSAGDAPLAAPGTAAATTAASPTGPTGGPGSPPPGGALEEHHEVDLAECAVPVSDHPYTRLFMASSTGRYLGFDIVDALVPYTRRVLGRPTPEDSGVWRGLEPDLPRLPNDDENGVRLLARYARDGGVRASLMELGISKAQWETASPVERSAVKGALVAVEALGDAVRAALAAEDQRLRRSAVKFLNKVVKVATSDQGEKNTRSHYRFQRQSEEVARGRQLVDLANQLLRLVQRERRALATAADAEVRQAQRRQEFKKLNALGIGLAFTADHLSRLTERGTREIALDVVLEAMPGLTRELLSRGVRRQSGKPKRSRRRRAARRSAPR